MENPNTWGRAERVIMSALAEHDELMKQGVCGYSLPHRIVMALRNVHLLRDEPSITLNISKKTIDIEGFIGLVTVYSRLKEQWLENQRLHMLHFPFIFNETGEIPVIAQGWQWKSQDTLGRLTFSKEYINCPVVIE